MRTKSWMVAVALAAGAMMAPVQAATLVWNAPLAGLKGLQADEDGTGPLVTPIAASSAGTLEMLAWWGYHGVNSGGPALDGFSVVLGGSSLSGSVVSTVVDSASGLTRYALDFADMPWSGSASTLSLVNGTGTEWFWQGGRSASAQSYELIGTPAAGPTVPEPATAGLALLSLAAMSIALRRR